MAWFRGKQDVNDDQSGQPGFVQRRNTQLSREQARRDKMTNARGKGTNQDGNKGKR